MSSLRRHLAAAGDRDLPGSPGEIRRESRSAFEPRCPGPLPSAPPGERLRARREAAG